MLYTLVRIDQEKVKPRDDETPLRAAKRMAVEELHRWYPGEAIMGATVIEIDTIKKELLIKLVWG